MDDSWDDDGYFGASLSDEEDMMAAFGEPQHPDYDSDDEVEKEAAAVAEPPSSAMKRRVSAPATATVPWP